MKDKKLISNAIFLTTITEKKAFKKPLYLNFDMIDILIPLKSLISDYVWFVKNLDYDGPDIPDGKALMYEELIYFFSNCIQTIDGTLFGFNRKEITNCNVQQTWESLNVLKFENANCQIEIRAVDSSFFEVYSRTEKIPELLDLTFVISVLPGKSWGAT